MLDVQPPRTVLVVDDDEQVRRTLRRILEDRNYGCRVASSAIEAREALGFISFDAVITDVMMPGETGIGLLRSLRATNPELPIVMVSSVRDPDVANVALELGAYGYVTKPFDANQVVIAVDNAILRSTLETENRVYKEQLEWMVLERTIELADALDDLAASDKLLRVSSEATIDMLAQAIEGRDIETGQHIARMSRYAALLAHGCGLDEEQCRLIRLASPMHDIGKIGVADGILFKPGALTPAEFGVIKEHAEQGYRILAKSEHPLLQLAATIARTHHERWDGSGYPHGLTNTAIPIEGRISAVADVFDAVVSRRVYKEAYPLEQAVDVVRNGRATLFDPDVVDAFVEQLDDITEIRAQYADW
jgi:putative two-component system response regulator